MSIVKLLNLVDKGKLMEAIGNDESELWTVKGIRAVIEEQPVLMRIPETDIRVSDLIGRALDPAWLEDHHKMGFYSPMYEVMHMFDEDDNDERPDQKKRCD